MIRFYFAYGSNMKRARLEERVGTVTDHGMATLKDYRIAFNKKSRNDGTGKANILPAEREDVLGVLFEMSENQIKTLDKHEGGYLKVHKAVEFGGEIIEAQTYVASENMINDSLLPDTEYLGLLIAGAKEHGFPQEYQDCLKSFPVCK